VTTKVLSSVDDIPAAIKTSLKKLQLEYVDLFLIHSPYFADEGKDVGKLQSAWADMEKLKADGLAKSIGVSNYLIPHLEAVLATAKTPPSVNQVEYHPYLQRTKLVEFHKAHDIATESYGPLSAITKGKGGPADEYLALLAKKYAVSEGEICLRWAIDQGVIVVTTSGKEQRLSDYLRATKFHLTPAEVQELSKVSESKHLRGFWGKKFEEDDRS
jgi:diketogulonate reductase-like aldo/keto reductase